MKGKVVIGLPVGTIIGIRTNLSAWIRFHGGGVASSHLGVLISINVVDLWRVNKKVLF